MPFASATIELAYIFQLHWVEKPIIATVKFSYRFFIQDILELFIYLVSQV